MEAVTQPAGRGRAGSKGAPGKVAELPRLLDVDGVADVLGVSVRHVRRLVAERRIPFLKWGHYVRFHPGEIEQWLEEARVNSSPAPRPPLVVRRSR